MLDVPDECAHAYLFVAFVQFADGKEEGFDLVVVDDGHDGVVHFGPGVGAPVWVAVGMAASLHIFPKGEATDFKHVEHVFNTFGVGLIEYYED